jgi:peptidoglycan/LPS O-acetylase OafA/YrhL
VAVLAVLAFHAGVGWLGGGLLGVDVFFVLSGFLVTALLLAEYHGTGTIALGRFWARRARRLLPALLVLLLGMCVYARWAGSGMAPAQVRGDALATLAYVANWHFVATGQDYFVHFGATSPLLHTWSLAVEEQFYLVWPIVALGVLRRFGRSGVGWAAGVLAVGSAALCGGLLASGASLDRLYFGTDTRSQAIMVGALVAVLVPLTGRSKAAASAARSRLVAVAGTVGALALGVGLWAAKGSGAFLYEGGFLAVAAGTAAVVALVVEQPGNVVSRLLSWRPLRYVGRISYGLYLYHWPIFLVIDGRSGLGPLALLAARFGATFIVAALSFRFVERPIRSWRPSGRGLPRWAPLGAVGAAALGLVALLLVATAAPPASSTLSPGGRPPTRFHGPFGLDSAHPERALLVGDSMALTLGWGLGRDANAWGVSVDNRGSVGCDLDPTTTVNVMGTISSAAQGCPRWQTDWSQLVDRLDPDVVVVLLGRWDCLDRLYSGRWTHVGEAVFDRHLQSELGRVIDIGSARGARVVLLTLPFIAQTTEQPNGSPWAMNLPSRTDAFNADIRRAVAEHPGKAAMLDLNKLLDPGGHYTSFVKGVRVRGLDDEHISPAGGELVRGSLLPALVQIGLTHYEGSHRAAAA